MTDIVERLRTEAPSYVLIGDAAIEIERLREALEPFADKFLYPDDTGIAEQVRSEEGWSEETNDSMADDVWIERGWVRKARAALEGK